MELTDKQWRLQQRIANAKAAACNAENRLARYKAMCQHVYAQSAGESSYCVVCGNFGGWYCPENPTHVCQYSRDFDSCDFCGEPEERK